MYTYGYLEPRKGNIRDAAFAVSVHDDVLNRTVRINLRWTGNHDISARFPFTTNGLQAR